MTACLTYGRFQHCSSSSCHAPRNGTLKKNVGNVMAQHRNVNEAAHPVSALSLLLRNVACHTGAGHAARPFMLGWHGAMQRCRLHFNLTTLV